MNWLGTAACASRLLVLLVLVLVFSWSLYVPHLAVRVCADGVGVAAVAGRGRGERRWYDTLFCSFGRACAMVRAWRGLLWPLCCRQAAEQVCREVEAADAASVARLVRGVCSSYHDPRNAMLPCFQ